MTPEVVLVSISATAQRTYSPRGVSWMEKVLGGGEEERERESLRLRGRVFSSSFRLRLLAFPEFRNAIWSSFQAFLTFVNSEGITTGSLSAATETERDCCCLLGARAGQRMREPAAAAADFVDDARAVCIVSKKGITRDWSLESSLVCSR
jgi:hypothetical protein